jgi:hypothetical protein
MMCEGPAQFFGSLGERKEQASCGWALAGSQGPLLLPPFSRVGCTSSPLVGWPIPNWRGRVEYNLMRLWRSVRACRKSAMMDHGTQKGEA